MKYRNLGRTGLNISEIGLGTWPMGGDEYGVVDDAECVCTIQAAIDNGVTFIDTADVYGYGHAESLIRQALEGRTEKVVIATKIGNDMYSVPPQPGGGGKNFSREYLVKATEGCLSRLGVETLDLLILHNPSLDLIRQGVIFESMHLLMEQGKIRYYGVSIYNSEEGLEAIRVGKPHALMITFNLIRQDPRLQLFPLAEKEGIGLLIRSPLGEGLLSGKYTPSSVFQNGDHRRDRGKEWLVEGTSKTDQLRFLEKPDRTLAQAALAFILSHPQVSSVVSGAKNRSQLLENIAAASYPGLTKEELRKIYEIYANNFSF